MFKLPFARVSPQQSENGVKILWMNIRKTKTHFGQNPHDNLLTLLVSSNDTSIPEDFLDPITQEVMLLPMLLPSGMSVDNSTLEEHQKREATWGRAPNDPFTGVPFTSSSQPLPNPQLKARIDQFLLQRGIMGRQGMLGRKPEGENLQASRLVAADGQKPQGPSRSLKRSLHIENSQSEHPSDDVCNTSEALDLESQSAMPTLSRSITEERTESGRDQPPQSKRPRSDTCEKKFPTILSLNSVLIDYLTITPHSRHQRLLPRAAFVRELGRGAALRPAGSTFLHLQPPPEPRAGELLQTRIDRWGAKRDFWSVDLQLLFFSDWSQPEVV